MSAVDKVSKTKTCTKPNCNYMDNNVLCAINIVNNYYQWINLSLVSV